MSNKIRNFLLLRNKTTMLKKCSLPQISFIRNKQNMTSKDQNKTADINNEDNINDEDKPIKYSTTKAYHMKANEYRLGNKDFPWYQEHCIFLSIAVFLIYFCALREENDIDLLLYNDLSETLKYNEQKKLRAEAESKKDLSNKKFYLVMD